MSDAPLTGTFGRYRIERRLGAGAMGDVYLAHDTQLDRPVALKIPKLTPDDGPEVLERFLREARAAAGLHHPNICPVYDAGICDGRHFMTTGYVAGRPLSESFPLPVAQVVVLTRKLALALAEAHAQGVIHRDLKPSNVMLDPRGEPVIVDFGLARITTTDGTKLTRTGAVMGTPAYMSPEQVDGDLERMGPASDIYSLGVMLYEMLTGRLPFTGSVASVLGQIMSREPAPLSAVNPTVTRRLEAICLRTMAKTPESRFPSMSALAAALSDWESTPDKQVDLATPDALLATTRPTSDPATLATTAPAQAAPSLTMSAAITHPASLAEPPSAAAATSPGSASPATTPASASTAPPPSPAAPPPVGSPQASRLTPQASILLLVAISLPLIAIAIAAFTFSPPPDPAPLPPPTHPVPPPPFHPSDLPRPPLRPLPPNHALPPLPTHLIPIRGRPPINPNLRPLLRGARPPHPIEDMVRRVGSHDPIRVVEPERDYPLSALKAAAPERVGPALLAALDSPDPAVRRWAATNLTIAQYAPATPELERRLTTDHPDHSISADLEPALGFLQVVAPDHVVPALIKVLNSREPHHRAWAARSLAATQDPRAAPDLEARLKSPAPYAGIATDRDPPLEALAILAPDRVRPVLTELLKDSRQDVRAWAARELAQRPK